MLKQRLTTDLMEYVRKHWVAIDGADSDGNAAAGAKRKRRPLDVEALAILGKWWEEHINEPYPTEEDKAVLAASANLTIVQVNNWFRCVSRALLVSPLPTSNKRVRSKRKSEPAKPRRRATNPPASPPAAAATSGVSLAPAAAAAPSAPNVVPAAAPSAPTPLPLSPPSVPSDALGAQNPPPSVGASGH